MICRGLTSTDRRKGALRNGAFGVLEYAAQPLGIVLAAPCLLRHLGTAQFGVWVIASAAVSGGNTVSSGFGDAAIRYVAMYRGRENHAAAEQAIRATLAINLVLSGLVAVALWLLVPFVADRAIHGNELLRASCATSLRIGCLLLVVRSVDSVLGCVLRAFERYGPAVWISTCFRSAVLVAAVAMSMLGRGVVAIMAATLILALLSVVIQGITVQAVAGRILLLPSFESAPLKQIVNFGSFSWLQGLCAVAIGQADRLIVGIALGASAVAVYGLCAQVAQSIHGTIAAGFHVLFPHFSRRIESDSPEEIRGAVKSALRINIAAAALVGALFVLFGRPILLQWMGLEFSRHAWPVFATLSIAYALFAMNVTAHYTLLALGHVRVVTFLNILAAGAMLALMLPLAARFGTEGAASARLVAGPITCLLYLPLLRHMRAEFKKRPGAAVEAALENA